MKYILIFLSLSYFVRSFINLNLRYKQYVPKLYVKFIPDDPTVCKDIFDKFEYYSLKNDTVKQMEVFKEIAHYLKQN